MAHDFLGHTAEQHPLDSAATVAAYYDEIGRPLLGNLHDARGWMPAFHIVQGGRRQWQTLMEATKQSLAFLNGYGRSILLSRAASSEA